MGEGEDGGRKTVRVCREHERGRGQRTEREGEGGGTGGPPSRPGPVSSLLQDSWVLDDPGEHRGHCPLQRPHQV